MKGWFLLNSAKIALYIKKIFKKKRSLIALNFFSLMRNYIIKNFAELKEKEINI